MRDCARKQRLAPNETKARGDRNGARLHPDRLPRGERVGTSKLTDADVLAIRDAYRRREASQYELAETYGVCQTAIGHVVRGTTWAHLPL